MLIMHYRIPLGGEKAAAAAAIRTRVSERGPSFDGMKGLERKFFLLDPVNPMYATVYLWRTADAALDFLQGPFFAALEASFGRPAVRLLLSTRVRLPDQFPRSVLLADGASECLRGPGVEAIDPLDGSRLALSFVEASAGRRFELVYVTRPDVVTA